LLWVFDASTIKKKGILDRISPYKKDDFVYWHAPRQDMCLKSLPKSLISSILLQLFPAVWLSRQFMGLTGKSVDRGWGRTGEEDIFYLRKI
jgi:hypothetical protein